MTDSGQRSTWLPLFLLVAVGALCLAIGIAIGRNGNAPNLNAEARGTPTETEVPTTAGAEPPATTAPTTAPQTPPTTEAATADGSTGTELVLERSWRLLTSPSDLPAPKPGSTDDQMTGSIVGDFDGDGDTDFAIAGRRAPGPSLVWYEQTESGWSVHPVEPDVLPLEAGGTAADIDGDGDIDLAIGGDRSSDQIWWWENPGTTDSSRWERHVVKAGGATKHHDLVFGDVDSDGDLELVYWNQAPGPGDALLFLAEIPADPRTGPWPAEEILSAPTGSEGLAIFDVDGDDREDVLAGGTWLRSTADGFDSTQIDPNYTNVRVVAGQFIPGGHAEIVFDSGDGNGPLNLYTWDGSSWVVSELDELSRSGHSLRTGDVDGDGLLDLMTAEMLSPGSTFHAGARLRILFGDGTGGFTEEMVAQGVDNHESQLVDLDGDGDLDILGKPFNGGEARVNIWLQDLVPTTTPPAPPQTPGTESEIAGSADQSWQRQEIETELPWTVVLAATGDLDGDGFPDAAVGPFWYKNPGTAGAEWTRSRVGAHMNSAATIFDFDNDGDLDILGTAMKETREGNRFAVAINDGQGTFRISDVGSTGAGDFLQGIAVGPLDESGNNSVLLSWHADEDRTTAFVVPENPVGVKWPLEAVSDISNNEQLAMADLDNDGDLDIHLGTQWLRNDGDGFTAFPVVIETGPQPDRVVLADMDNDGDIDVVIGYENDPDGRVAWYEQGPEATALWTEHVIGNVTNPLSVGVGDLDGDGDQDVVVGEHNKPNPDASRLWVFTQDDGAWDATVVHEGDEHHDGTVVIDLDLDGDLDILSIGFLHSRIHVYWNESQ